MARGGRELLKEFALGFYKVLDFHKWEGGTLLEVLGKIKDMI